MFPCSRIAFALAASVLTIGFASPSFAQCPVGDEIRVDNDIPNSGYSEVRAENWATWGTNACHGTYRYTSHTVGDGSREGKAVWDPAIQVEGWYDVTVGFRLTENRTTHADYYVYDDQGGVDHTVIDQYVADRDQANCERRSLGSFFCRPGGSCRVVLDSTDGYDSPSADITVFTLERCPDGSTPDAGTDDAGTDDAGSGARRCDGIRQNSSFELCGETDTTCTGVFTNGEGCEAFCNAADMDCVAKFGGEPGCQKESDLPLTCGDATGHESDWCECAGDPLPDPDPMDAGTEDVSPRDTATEDTDDVDTSGGEDVAQDSVEADDDTSSEQDSSSNAPTDSSNPGSDADDGLRPSSGSGSCSCASSGTDPYSGLLWACVFAGFVWASRRRGVR